MYKNEQMDTCPACLYSLSLSFSLNSAQSGGPKLLEHCKKRQTTIVIKRLIHFMINFVRKGMEWFLFPYLTFHWKGPHEMKNQNENISCISHLQLPSQDLNLNWLSECSIDSNDRVRSSFWVVSQQLDPSMDWQYSLIKREAIESQQNDQLYSYGQEIVKKIFKYSQIWILY